MSINLRAAREEAGYTVEEIATELNIRKQYIISLEEDNFEALPGDVYVKGYRKVYCEFLGIKLSEKPVINRDQAVKKINLDHSPPKYKNYTVFCAIIALILVILSYTMVKSSLAHPISDERIQTIQRQVWK